MTLPLSPSYRRPAYEAILLQVLICFFASLILDGGTAVMICLIAAGHFWIVAGLLIWRRPQSPTRTGLELLRFGYLPMVVTVFLVFHATLVLLER